MINAGADPGFPIGRVDPLGGGVDLRPFDENMGPLVTRKILLSSEPSYVYFFVLAMNIQGNLNLTDFFHNEHYKKHII